MAFHAMTIASGIRSAMRKDPGKLAVRHGDKTVTYRQLSERIDRLTAAAITELGLGKGDTAAIVANNCIEYVEVISGLPEAGVPVATVSSRLAGPEIRRICNDAGARVVFTDRSCVEEVSKAGFDMVEHVILFGEQYEALLETAASPNVLPQIDETDTWTIPYTSGTTGAPKGVMISHRSRVLCFYQQAMEYGCYSPDDRFLATTPLNHGGNAFPMAAVVLGGYVEILDGFDPERVLRKLKDEHITGVFTVPTQQHAFFELEAPVLDRYRGTDLKAIISASAPLSQHLKEQILDYFGDGLLHETYGSTETGIVTNLRPKDQLRKQRSVGRPFAHTHVKLADDGFNDVPPDEPGELWVKSATNFSGYWGQPEETEAAHRDGWVTVGDVARRDEEGFYYIVGRKKDMVITGGVNVYPREIEDVISTHPAVLEAAVVGVPDEQWGERLEAFIVLQPGAALSAEAIRLYCLGKIAKYKAPKKTTIVQTLPRNSMGKVVKEALAKIK